MKAASVELRDHLTPGESVVGVGVGTLVQNARRTDGVIGITDRRVVFVANGEGFTDVGHDHISAVESRPRRTLTSRAVAYWLLAGSGVLLAVSVSVMLVAMAASILGVVLTAWTIGGLALSVYVWSHGVDPDWLPPRASAPLADDGTQALLALGLGLLATVTFIGLVALTESLLVLPLTLAALCGIALVDDASRRIRRLNRGDGSHRNERDVRIHLLSGHTVHLRVDSTARIDHELSKVACADTYVPRVETDRA